MAVQCASAENRIKINIKCTVKNNIHQPVMMIIHIQISRIQFFDLRNITVQEIVSLPECKLFPTNRHTKACLQFVSIVCFLRTAVVNFIWSLWMTSKHDFPQKYMKISPGPISWYIWQINGKINPIDQKPEKWNQWNEGQYALRELLSTLGASRGSVSAAPLGHSVLRTPPPVHFTPVAATLLLPQSQGWSPGEEDPDKINRRFRPSGAKL
jgi:hypothetical protein